METNTPATNPRRDGNSVACQRERTDAELTEPIQKIHTELSGDPGVRRAHAELLVRGQRVSPTRVKRFMKAAGPQGRHLRAWGRTTIQGWRPPSDQSAVLSAHQLRTT
ncbi:MAG: IS3 family transposase [Pseudonocardiaceae bacterium]